MPRSPSAAGPELDAGLRPPRRAAAAAEFGLPFSHAYFISPEGSEEAVAAYRERFKPSDACPAPVVTLGVAALAAETEEDARALSQSRYLWVVRLLTGRPIPFPPPDEARDYPFTEQERALLRSVERRSIVGTPQHVRAGLTALAECAWSWRMSWWS